MNAASAEAIGRDLIPFEKYSINTAKTRLTRINVKQPRQIAD